jgi:hypothetical protein
VQAEGRPRVWTPLVLGGAVLSGIISVSTVMSFAVLILAGGFDPKKPPTDETAFYAAFEKVATHLWGIALMVVPGQLTMIAAAIGAAL